MSVQPFRVPASPGALSPTRKVQSPAIPVPPKSGVYVRTMSSALPPLRSCSALAVPSGATSSTVRSPMNGCAMSTETETDVAVPGPGTVIASDTAGALSGMASAGVLVCANRPGALPPPVLSGDSSKSPASTPVTSPLNVTAKTRVCAEVASPAGSLLSTDVTVGAAASGSVSAGWLPAASLVAPRSPMFSRTYLRAAVNSSTAMPLLITRGARPVLTHAGMTASG